VAYDGNEREATLTWSPVRDFVRRLARRRLKRADLADDVAQETVLRLIEYERGGRIDNLYGLATRIAENLVNEQFRRERRWGAEELSESIVSGQPSPERVVEGREAVETLKRALERMPRLRREIIIRRRIHRQSCAFIAEELGLNLKAVEKHVTRGLLDLNEACGQKRRGPGAAH
jgi:RNA polymerase sigma-70 factor (ECF subfamily)